jgi:hypothetical protein
MRYQMDIVRQSEGGYATERRRSLIRHERVYDEFGDSRLGRQHLDRAGRRTFRGRALVWSRRGIWTREILCDARRSCGERAVGARTSVCVREKSANHRLTSWHAECSLRLI